MAFFGVQEELFLPGKLVTTGCHRKYNRGRQLVELGSQEMLAADIWKGRRTFAAAQSVWSGSLIRCKFADPGLKVERLSKMVLLHMKV
jgi:hypothetical protein